MGDSSSDLLAIEQLGIPRDTSLESMRFYLGLLAALPCEERLDLAMKASREIAGIAEAGARDRHPDYDDGQILRAVRRLSLGEEEFRRHFPGDNIRP